MHVWTCVKSQIMLAQIAFCIQLLHAIFLFDSFLNTHKESRNAPDTGTHYAYYTCTYKQHTCTYATKNIHRNWTTCIGTNTVLPHDKYFLIKIVLIGMLYLHGDISGSVVHVCNKCHFQKVHVYTGLELWRNKAKQVAVFEAITQTVRTCVSHDNYMYLWTQLIFLTNFGKSPALS